jgi:putative hemolysin
LNTPGPAVLHASATLPFENTLGALESTELALLASLALLLTGFFAVLRSALLHSVPSRVLEKAKNEAEEKDLRPLLERAEALATSASLFEITCQILFIFIVLALPTYWQGESSWWESLGFTLAISVPLLVFASEVLPSALRGEPSDRLLRSALPGFDLLQRPLMPLNFGLDVMRRGVMRVFRIPEPPRSARRIVEGIRDVIEESEREADLGESEREIIENVVEFYDVDVAEVMTPRTELTAVDLDSGVHEVVRAIAESGHSRIPVFEQNLDMVIGVAYAQEIIQLVSSGELTDSNLRSLLRPVSFVPETKLLSELLADFRRDKQKMAVVLDEYGGTAGLVTIGDIMAELVGDMPEELGDSAPQLIHSLPDGRVEVQASIRVSEVNEELELEIPEEEDYETLAGFVLSELGRFPKNGEGFHRGGIEFTVSEANDRRVLKVVVNKQAKVQEAG